MLDTSMIIEGSSHMSNEKWLSLVLTTIRDGGESSVEEFEQVSVLREGAF